MAVIELYSPSEQRERDRRRQAPWNDAWVGMLVEMSNLGMPPRIRGQADSSDWLTHKEWLLRFAGVVDTFLEAYSDGIDEHAHSLDVSLFHGQLTGALDKNATYELQRQADLLTGEAE